MIYSYHNWLILQVSPLPVAALARSDYRSLCCVHYCNNIAYGATEDCGM